MGTDCRLIAKLKDDTYRHRDLDRLYVFNLPFKDHSDIYDAGGLVEDERGIVVTNHRFTLEHLADWCHERRKLIAEATIAELEEDCITAAKRTYYIHWISEALEFAVKMLDLRDQIEWIGLYDDMDDLYFDLKNDMKTIIDI